MPNFRVPNDPSPHFLSDSDMEAGGVDLLPTGATEISADEAAAMLRVLNPEPTSADLIRIQIAELERQQTDRRVREAALGIDKGWLANLNDQIEALRKQL